MTVEHFKQKLSPLLFSLILFNVLFESSRAFQTKLHSQNNPTIFTSLPKKISPLFLQHKTTEKLKVEKKLKILKSFPLEKRRNVLLRTLTSVSAATGLLFSTANTAGALSNAIITSSDVKIANRSIKKSLDELKQMEFLVVDNDYNGVRQTLRVPPLTEVRKNCGILIKKYKIDHNIFDDPTGKEAPPPLSELEIAYKEFIKDIEDLDSKAGLGSRGRKGIELDGYYRRSVEALTVFLDKASETVDAAAASTVATTT